MSSSDAENPPTPETPPQFRDCRSGCWNYLFFGIIIVVAYGVLFPFPTGPVPERPKAHAQKSAADLRSAIMMYHSDYKSFPVLPGTSTSADSAIDTSAQSGLISVLVAMPDNDLMEKVNRRQIQYFSDKAAREASKPGIYRFSGHAHLRDPWGNFYLVYMDTNGDGKITITYPNGKTEVIRDTVTARSLGPNGVINYTPGAKKDDILAK